MSRSKLFPLPWNPENHGKCECTFNTLNVLIFIEISSSLFELLKFSIDIELHLRVWNDFLCHAMIIMIIASSIAFRFLQPRSLGKGDYTKVRTVKKMQNNCSLAFQSGWNPMRKVISDEGGFSPSQAKFWLRPGCLFL